MSKSKLLVALFAATSVAVFSYCDDTSNAPTEQPDAATGRCESNDECPVGECLNHQCLRCQDVPCAKGQLCQENGRCAPCPGGVCAADAGVDAGAEKCSVRADCPNGLACRGGKCGQPAADGKCLVSDECLAGYYCGFKDGKEQCVKGCETNADCRGSEEGPRCDTTTTLCGPCATKDDCAPGENCSKGKCELPKTCVAPDRTPCGDLACIGNVCSPCASKGDCGAGYECYQGKCLQAGGCTDDSQCKNISAGHICDETSGNCEWGCLKGTGPQDPACGANCCPAGKTCNTTTHACVEENCDCGGNCNMNEVCDQETCTCVSDTPDGGGIIPTDGCDQDCKCPTGKTCVCEGGACLLPAIQCAVPGVLNACE